MRARRLTAAMLLMAATATSACGLAQVTYVALGGGWLWNPYQDKSLAEDGPHGVLRVENEGTRTFYRIRAVRDPGDEPLWLEGDAEPLEPGRVLELPFPAGVWSEIQLHAFDGSVEAFHEVVVPIGEVVVLQLE